MVSKRRVKNGWHAVCRLDAIPDGQARGLLRQGNDDRIFAVRLGEEVFVWHNDCPHNHRPLEYRQDAFLSADGSHIICYAHSAHFNIRDGQCFAGPCKGQALTPIAFLVHEGVIWIEPLLSQASSDESLEA